MNISGWNYDFSSLPHWEAGETDDYAQNKLYESADGRFCYFLYAVKEVRPSDFRGFAAIFKNKENPQLVFSGKCACFPNEAPFLSDSQPILAFLASFYSDDTNCNIDVTVIADIEKHRYAFAPLYQSESRCLYPIEEKKGKILLLNRDSSKRNITKLTYRPLDTLGSVLKVEIKMNMFGNIQILPV